MIPPQLSGLPELAGLCITACDELGDGLANRSWRVRSDAGDWVIRWNEEQSAESVPSSIPDRHFECRVLRAVAGRDLGPRVIACEPAAGYLITEFLDQPAWDRHCFNDAEALRALARSLRELHAMREPEAEAAPWRDELVSLAATGPLCGSQPLKEGIGQLIQDLEQTGFDQGPVALCHHDLHAANILGQAPVRFIDFEYARWTHPAMDIAWLIQYHDLVPEQCDLLLGAYYGRSGPDVTRFMALAVRLAQYQELLWLAARSARGPLTEMARSRLRALRLVLT